LLERREARTIVRGTITSPARQSRPVLILHDIEELDTEESTTARGEVTGDSASKRSRQQREQAA
jgi:hypothetical protein